MTELRVETFKKLPPLIVTYAQLEKTMAATVGADRWAQDTIGDLWRMATPHPTHPYKRIVFPGKLAEWLADVLERQGRPLDAAARAYVKLQGEG